MMEYALVFNSTIRATSTRNATTACTATRVAGALSTRKWERDAPRTRLAEENQCAFLKQRSLHTVCVEKSSPCRRIPSSCRCTRRIWQTLTQGFLCISKISKRFAAQVISIRHLAAVSLDLNLRIRVVYACPTWIAPPQTQLFLLNASADTHPREPNIVT